MAVGGWIDLQHNAPHQISVADLNYSDADNDPLASLTVQTLPNLGTLELYGYPVYAGQEVYASDTQFGYFNYVPTGDAGTSYSASFSFSVSDGWDSSASTASLGFQVTVTPNSPPTIGGSNHPLNSPQSHALTIADLGYSDADGDALQSITILNPPSLGTLQYYGYPVSSGQTFYSYDIDWGYLTYVPNPSANATYQDSFTFTANDGFDDSLPATVAYTVNVTPNSPPVVTGSTLTLQGNQSHTITIADLGYSDPDGDPLQSITIHSIPTSGILEYYGYSIYSGQTFYSYDIEWGYLTYVPNPSANETYQDSFTFTANDGFSDSLPATIVVNSNGNQQNSPIASFPAILIDSHFFLGNDNEHTRNVNFVGTVMGQTSAIAIDVNLDGSADYTTPIHSDGTFSISFTEPNAGLSEIKYAFVQNSGVLSQWQSIETFLPPPQSASPLAGLSLVIQRIVGNPDDAMAGVQSLQGEIFGVAAIEGLELEIDYEGDGFAETYFSMSGIGAFAFEVIQGALGEYSLARLSVTSIEYAQAFYSDWVSVQTVQYEVDPGSGETQPDEETPFEVDSGGAVKAWAQPRVPIQVRR